MFSSSKINAVICLFLLLAANNAHAIFNHTAMEPAIISNASRNNKDVDTLIVSGKAEVVIYSDIAINPSV